MNKDWETHECSRVPKEGVQVIFYKGYALRDELSWILVIRRNATERDLQQNNYLEEEGQTRRR